MEGVFSHLRAGIIDPLWNAPYKLKNELAFDTGPERRAFISLNFLWKELKDP
jgi:hypothetical protein